MILTTKPGLVAAVSARHAASTAPNAARLRAAIPAAARRSLSVRLYTRAKGEPRVRQDAGTRPQPEGPPRSPVLPAHPLPAPVWPGNGCKELAASPQHPLGLWGAVMALCCALRTGT